MNLKEALSKLDPTNDEHWTTDGSPLLEPLKELMGEDGGKLTRSAVNAEFPHFSRKTPFADMQADVAEAAKTALAQSVNGESFLPSVEGQPSSKDAEPFTPDSELLDLNDLSNDLDSELSRLQADKVRIEAEIFRVQGQINTIQAKLTSAKRLDPVQEYLAFRVARINGK